MKIAFFIEQAYYYPHFLPIAKVLMQRGDELVFILSKKNTPSLNEQIAKENALAYSFDESLLYSPEFNYIFFANGFKEFNKIKAKKVFLEHGIGTKSTSFYPLVKEVDIYLVEGEQKYNTIASLYPYFKDRLHIVGYSKFDDIVNLDNAKLLKKYNLDSSKKTILYAPTFFPSSIEKMPLNFPADFSECNIIIKPHYFTYESKKYKNQLKRLEHWAKFANVKVLGVEEYNITPLLAISDVMISDESSAMFEFAMLNKPVISNRYFKLRLSYYIMPWKLSKRIDKSKDRYRDIFYNAKNYKETLEFTKRALSNPNELSQKRQKVSKEICGIIDGKVSLRIAKLLK